MLCRFWFSIMLIACCAHCMSFRFWFDDIISVEALSMLQKFVVFIAQHQMFYVFVCER